MSHHDDDKSERENCVIQVHNLIWILPLSTWALSRVKVCANTTSNFNYTDCNYFCPWFLRMLQFFYTKKQKLRFEKNRDQITCNMFNDFHMRKHRDQNVHGEIFQKILRNSTAISETTWTSDARQDPTVMKMTCDKLNMTRADVTTRFCFFHIVKAWTYNQKIFNFKRKILWDDVKWVSIKVVSSFEIF